MADSPANFVLTLACDDGPGIVAAVSGCLAEHGGNILESAQFGDPATGRFFMRIRFAALDGTDQAGYAFALKPIADRFGMRWEVADERRPGRVLLLVSKFDHCLNDLLYRWRSGAIAMDVVGIASNHDDHRHEADAAGVPYHWFPVTKETKPAQEAALLTLIESERVDLVILARYMQILSDKLANRLFGKVINIHHSFLPSFKGARPYHQAHERGVKLIGATAHYVTAALDEGPIIEQATERVTHADTPDELVRIGRDIECRVLARAVKWHLEHRVLINNAKTVVFA